MPIFAFGHLSHHSRMNCSLVVAVCRRARAATGARNWPGDGSQRCQRFSEAREFAANVWERYPGRGKGRIITHMTRLQDASVVR
jgi:hypothetical protein